MKQLVPLLVLSLVGNAVLALGPWQNRHASAPSLRQEPRPTTASATATAPESSLRSAVDSDPALSAAIRGENPKQLLAALLQAGFPERYARAMVMAETNAFTSREVQEFFRRQAATPFWRLGDLQLGAQDVFREASQKSRERLREAFDGRIPADYYTIGRNESRYRFLPADKIAAVARIDADYASMAMESRGERVGPTQFDPAVTKLLEQERRADLAQILTPAEMELHDLYLSSSAESLRRYMSGFEPTEAEFRAMYAIRRAIDEESGRPINLPGFTSYSSRDNEKYRAALSPERFAEFQRGQDMGYRAALEIVSHFKLPSGAAAQAYELQRAYQELMRDRQATSTPEARRELAQKARADFARVLGQPGADAYFSTAGHWIGSLERPPTVRTPVRLDGG